MEREEALRELTSEDSKQRFVAANALEMAGQSEDIASLLRARILETDAMVLSSIERAILKCGERDATPAQEIERGDPASYRAAVEWVSGVLVHEIGGKVGLVDYCASLEIGDYEKSRTKESMTALSSTLSAVEQLQLASKAAAQEQFDLAELVQETIDVESFDSSVEIFSIGSKPFFVFGVRRLLQLAIRNGVKNAVEASKAAADLAKARQIDAERMDPYRVVVNWARTDRDWKLSVVDSGIGLPPTPTRWFDLGASTKSGHIGFGLAIARQAMETMGGVVSLEPSSGGGALFLISWHADL